MDRVSQPFQSKSICDGFSDGLVQIHIFWMENFSWVGLSAWTFALKLLLLLLLVTISMPMLEFTCIVWHQNRSSFYFNVASFFSSTKYNFGDETSNIEWCHRDILCYRKENRKTPRHQILYTAANQYICFWRLLTQQPEMPILPYGNSMCFSMTFSKYFKEILFHLILWAVIQHQMGLLNFLKMDELLFSFDLNPERWILNTEKTLNGFRLLTSYLI